MSELGEKDAVESCGCFACIGDVPAYEGAWLTIGMSRMIVCATCGNKRCPHGTDHRHACTESNEPGQPGSRYGNAVIPAGLDVIHAPFQDPSGPLPFAAPTPPGSTTGQTHQLDQETP